ncbi:hypothetical protein ACFTWF_32580 [Rhodococcus sp. NPDC056960]|uniref:hypothetical protein n=1 Tax=Rhodococcus sp. NPDC056960 TaxID=3345982 RepID=UPI00362CC6BE
MSVFADLTELTNYLRPTPIANETRATLLLEMAANLIRRRVSDVDTNTTYGNTAKFVQLEMVADALSPGEFRGRTSYSVSLDDAVESATLANPTATLVLTRAHLKLFGLSEDALPSWHFGDGPCP